MNHEKYIGMDVHQATISVAVVDGRGKLIMECILETRAGTILEFIGGLQGSLSVTFEEGTSAAWLHDLLKPHVAHLVVCDPRKNALLKDGSKSDRIDARKLAELLRLNKLNPVYHRLCPASSRRMVGQDCRTWSSSAGPTAVPATGSAAARASTSAPRPTGGESQACGREVAAAGSCDRSDSCRLAGGTAADATPFPH